jgi:hypothetical protein
MLAAQFEFGSPPRSVNDLPPLAENPSPVPSSLEEGDGQGETREVASFHASTTYCPVAPTEVSD